jgi:hypothetical protein
VELLIEANQSVQQPVEGYERGVALGGVTQERLDDLSSGNGFQLNLPGLGIDLDDQFNSFCKKELEREEGIQEEHLGGHHSSIEVAFELLQEDFKERGLVGGQLKSLDNIFQVRAVDTETDLLEDVLHLLMGDQFRVEAREQIGGISRVS